VSRIEPIAVENAEGTARELLDEVARHGGKPGPMTRAMANAPALLKGYVDLSRAMKRTNIDRRIVERINLAVHDRLRCDYCLLAHTRAARKLGVSESEMRLARHGTSADPSIAAIVAFALQILTAPGDIGDADVERLREHGYSDEQIAEVVGLVSLQLLTGAFNLMAGIDAPPEARAEIVSR